MGQVLIYHILRCSLKRILYQRILAMSFDAHRNHTSVYMVVNIVRNWSEWTAVRNRATSTFSERISTIECVRSHFTFSITFAHFHFDFVLSFNLIAHEFQAGIFAMSCKIPRFKQCALDGSNSFSWFTQLILRGKCYIYSSLFWNTEHSRRNFYSHIDHYRRTEKNARAF